MCIKLLSFGPALKRWAMAELRFLSLGFNFWLELYFISLVYLKTSCLCNHTQIPCFWIHKNEWAGGMSSYTIWVKVIRQVFECESRHWLHSCQKPDNFSVTIIIANVYCDELHLHKCPKRFSLFLPFLFIADKTDADWIKYQIHDAKQ